MLMRNVKEIRGSVFLDLNFNEARDSSEVGLKDISVNLFMVGEKSVHRDENINEEIIILKEKFIAKIITNERGEFRFFVPPGYYALNLEIETLPKGYGVLDANKFVGTEDRGTVEFAVRRISSIAFNKDTISNTFIGGDINLCPDIKDERGNKLNACYKLIAENRNVDTCTGICRITGKSMEKQQLDIYADVGTVRGKLTLNVNIPELCSTEKVRLAHRLGMIDENTRVLNSLYSIFDRKKLPGEYRSGIPVKCGTGVVEEARRYAAKTGADKRVVEEIERYLSLSVPELDKTYRSPGGFFNIHYTTKGEHAVSFNYRSGQAVPPYIEQIGIELDNVKRITCDERGFRMPLMERGKDSLDVFVYDLKGVYGITFVSQYQDNPGSKAKISSSYIALDNSYSKDKGFDNSRDDCMRVTAAHEFFHAVQNAYNVGADSWWKEASATWNEDEIYNGINDYIRYLDNFFSLPQRSIDENTYSGVIFAKYLSENFEGYKIIKDIWEAHAEGYNNSIGAIDRVIREKYPKQDLGTAFDRFTACNFNPGQYYEEGALWDAAPAVQNTYMSYPVSKSTGRLSHLASNYQTFRPDLKSENKDIRIVIAGERGGRWGFKIQKRNRADGRCSIVEITSNGAYARAEVILKNFKGVYEEICLIPANLEKEKDGLEYYYSADLQ